MQVQVPLPRISGALAAVIADPRFPTAARSINHQCNYVTTFVAPRAGQGFHEPVHPPCLLNLHGTVHHWLRSAQAQPDVPVADARLAMQQWWMTADDAGEGSIEDLVRRFRTGLLQSNPITAQLVRACELCTMQPSNNVPLRFQHGDTGPDVSAVYHCGSEDRLPPNLILCKWAADRERPKCKPLKPGDSDNLAFVTLFPSADGTFHSNLSLTNGARMTRTQWTCHLIYAHVPHIVRQPRVLQEFLLQAWNEVENQRLRFFRQCVGPEDANLEDPSEANGGDSDSGHGDHDEGQASFIPAAFTGGALPALC
jgi:hypothetical protein